MRLSAGSNALQNVRFAAPERGKAALAERELKLAQITGAQGEIVRQVGGRGLERAPRDRVPPVRQARCTIAPDLAGELGELIAQRLIACRTALSAGQCHRSLDSGL
jgi:hypothetical protein